MFCCLYILFQPDQGSLLAAMLPPPDSPANSRNNSSTNIIVEANGVNIALTGSGHSRDSSSAGIKACPRCKEWAFRETDYKTQVKSLTAEVATLKAEADDHNATIDLLEDGMAELRAKYSSMPPPAPPKAEESPPLARRRTSNGDANSVAGCGPCRVAWVECVFVSWKETRMQMITQGHSPEIFFLNVF